MAPARSLAALAVLASLARANAVIYSYINGGQDWNATAANAKCGTGQNQSPINVADAVVTWPSANLAPLSVAYGNSTAWSLEITENYIEVGEIATLTTAANNAANTASGFTDGLTMPDGTLVPLNQFHFHSPSEHTLNGLHYPLEMHMVHKLFTDNGLVTGTKVAPPPAGCTAGTVAAPNAACGALARAAVIGIMFKYSNGADQPFIGKLTSTFNAVSANFANGISATDDTDVTSASGQFSLMTDVFGAVTGGGVGTQQYFNYNGSLTTPGCNEGINWYVMANPMSASPAQILAFTSMLAIEQNNGTGTSRGGDNRLVQPLNGRTIQASFPAGTPVVVTKTLTLDGITSLQFNVQAIQTAFINTIAASASVSSSMVKITSVTDVPNTGRRLLGAGVSVTYTVTLPTAAAAAMVRTSLNAAAAMPSNGASPLVAALAASISAAGGPAITVPSNAPVTSSASRAAAALATVVAAAAALAF